jgi:glycosyltransferase involved in cell wall biosynthesis
MKQNATCDGNTCVHVDVIVPVHNASKTIRETVESALHQWIPTKFNSSEESNDCLSKIDIDVAVCCHDDGSTDGSLKILEQIQRDLSKQKSDEIKAASTPQPPPPEGASRRIRTRLLVGTNADGVARGAGYARNRAAELRARNNYPSPTPTTPSSYLCLLDSDDIMHPFRIAEQLGVMLSIPEDGDRRERTLMGCTFDRIPPGSTWHYAEWANGLSDERLLLERYREVTLLQPTWFLSRMRFEKLGGYVEAPHPSSVDKYASEDDETGKNKDYKKRVSSNNEGSGRRYRLIHAQYDTPQTLRLAEDLRFFHEHLRASGLLRLHRTIQPLVTYRHRAGQSQSSSTPRKLLLNLRVMAFEDAILRTDPRWADCDFVIWGAGRDGKDFFKSLSPALRSRVRCFVDVDEKKIAAGFYANPDIGVKIPIVHFSLLAKDPQVRRMCIEDDMIFGRITKGAKKKQNADEGTRSKGSEDWAVTSAAKKKRPANLNDAESPSAKRRVVLQHNLGAKDSKELDVDSLPHLPVVVCVAMYRTNGVLERNVQSIGRVEGVDVWHFS